MLLKKQKDTCPYCGKAILAFDPGNGDHIVPRRVSQRIRRIYNSWLGSTTQRVECHPIQWTQLKSVMRQKTRWYFRVALWQGTVTYGFGGEDAKDNIRSHFLSNFLTWIIVSNQEGTWLNQNFRLGVIERPFLTRVFLWFFGVPPRIPNVLIWAIQFSCHFRIELYYPSKVDMSHLTWPTRKRNSIHITSGFYHLSSSLQLQWIWPLKD